MYLLKKIAELLEIDVETINNKLTAKWVKEDSFVPIETIPKVEEIDLMKIQPEEKTLEEQDCQNKLLEIPGVMLSDVEVRTYELGGGSSSFNWLCTVCNSRRFGKSSKGRIFSRKCNRKIWGGKVIRKAIKRKKMVVI